MYCLLNKVSYEPSVESTLGSDTDSSQLHCSTQYLTFPFFKNSVSSFWFINETVHPPHPAPVRRDPIAPESLATSVNVSSSVEEHLYPFEQDQ